MQETSGYRILESHNKRSEEVMGIEGVSSELAGHGYAPFGEWYHHDNGTKTFEGFITNGEYKTSKSAATTLVVVFRWKREHPTTLKNA